MSKQRPINERTISFPPDQAISWDAEAFDTAVRSQGVTLVHFRGMRCPVGMVDSDDIRRPHEDHAGCSNGLIYTQVGLVTALFTGNSHSVNQADQGLMDGSTVSVTFPRAYDDPPDLKFSALPMDRFFLAEAKITVDHWQLVEHHASGRDRLSFPAVCVTDLMDAIGKKYVEGADFQINSLGQIIWGQNRPGTDPATGKGIIYAVRYKYRPFWYLTRLVHEVRVSQIHDPVSGDRKLVQMPQAAQLQREYLFQGSEDADPRAPNPNSQRQAPVPSDNMFGAR